MPKPSATLSRFSRRQASAYGPMPGGACSSGRTAEASAENSVPVVSVVATRARPARVGARAGPCRRYLSSRVDQSLP